jgi:hypothetical protein
MSDDNLADDDGYDADAKVARFLGVHKKTLPRWDERPELLELGWPRPVFFNGRRHRHRPAVREFIKNAATAHVTKPLKT